MNAEILIKKEAKKFKRSIDGYAHDYDGHLKFKSDLETNLDNYYEPIDRLVYLYEIGKVIDELFDKHLLKCKFNDDPDKCPTNLYYYNCKFFTEQELKKLNPSFEYSILRPNINSDLIKQNLIKLNPFPDVAKVYLSALDKFNAGKFERNLLDDLRLAFELTLKSILKNSKSLENQLEELGKYLKEKEVSKEVIGMSRTLIDFYCKYQNDKVKHNDKVPEREVDLIVNLTSTFISFLIEKNKN